MKNLVILHLESISRQRLAEFAAAFPNVRRLLREALVFDNFFASATSTLMVVSYLLHGNDFEFDTETEFEGMRPRRNNRNLFSVLAGHGYEAGLICLNGFEARHPITLPAWPDDLPPVWGTDDFPTLFARFDALTDTPPFAIYVWNLITHIEHSLALAPYANGLTDQIRRACAVADDAVGEMLATLERKGQLANTTFVVFGDHGDDCWTHGFKGGMVHATEPYTAITHTPLAICDPGLAAGASDNLASTIDLAPTCLALLGIDEPMTFAHSGIDLLAGAREQVFAQNLTANQAAIAAFGIAQAFAVADRAWCLLGSARGLELYAYRLDPGNHCNLLHFFDLAPGGRLTLRPQPGAAGHYRSALDDNPRAVASLTESFAGLRTALAARVAAKRDYIVECGVDPVHALDPCCLDVIDDAARAAFFRRATVAGAHAPRPSFEFRYKLK